MHFHHRVELVTTDKIRMMHGTAPEKANAYDAHQMLAVAGPTIKRGS
jgi:hypothetical protein